MKIDRIVWCFSATNNLLTFFTLVRFSISADFFFVALNVWQIPVYLE